MSSRTRILCHLTAFLCAALWGSTFVSTKILIGAGLTPAQIFTIRFLMAYIPMLLVCHRRLWARTWRDEGLLFLLGLTGGSLYFLTENMALAYSTATNVSLLVCSCPLVTTLLWRLSVRGARLSRQKVGGAVLAFAGMVLVVLNGQFVLHLSPLGDGLAIVACLCWAVYSILLEPLSRHYSAAFITRKTFFYGLITILPYYLLHPGLPEAAVLLRTEVIGNLLFLGLIASLACFWVWNAVIERLGAVATTNYVYINPISTIIIASIVLGETITPYFLTGSAMIITGMYLSNARNGKRKNEGKNQVTVSREE